MVMCCKVGGGCCQEPDDNEPQQHCVWCEEIDRERVDRPGGPGGDSTSSFQGNKVKGGGLVNTTILVSSITMFYHDQYHLCSGERREAQTSYSSGNKLGKHNTKVTWIVQHHSAYRAFTALRKWVPWFLHIWRQQQRNILRRKLQMLSSLCLLTLMTSRDKLQRYNFIQQAN